MTMNNDTSRARGGPAYGPTPGFFVPSDPMSGLLAQNWWAIALRGIAGILFGIIAILLPGLTFSTTPDIESLYANSTSPQLPYRHALHLCCSAHCPRPGRGR